MIVATPLGKQMETCTKYEKERIMLRDNEFWVELTSLEFQDFDLILGMDFLSKYDTRIDCQTKNSGLTR